MTLISRGCVEYVTQSSRVDMAIGVNIVCAGTLQKLVVVDCHWPHNYNSDVMLSASSREMQHIVLAGF